VVCACACSSSVSNLRQAVCLSDIASALQSFLADTFGQSDPAKVHYDIAGLPDSFLAQHPCNYSCINGLWVGADVPIANSNSSINAINFSLVVSVVDPVAFYSTVANLSVGTKPIGRKGLTGISLVDISVLGGKAPGMLMQDCYRISRTQAAFFDTCLSLREGRVDMRRLKGDTGCTSGCIVSYCQFSNASRYDDFPPAGLLVCDKPGPCAQDGICGFPGARTGHAATTFTFQGLSMLLVFGGELQTVDATGGVYRSLTADTFVGSFQDSSLTFSRILIAATSPLPAPRRDASVAVIDQTTGMGKVLVFGGMTGSGRAMYAEDYLAGRYTGLTSLDDLWMLDLDKLGQGAASCLTFGKCPMISWREITVPGPRPLSRFGATMVLLDDSGQGELYVAGGVHMDTSGTVPTAVDLSDFYKFDLRAPLHQSCAATGRALETATAGQTGTFYIACANVFDQPAKGGQFSVEIRAAQQCSGCPTQFPTVKETAILGLYKCEYTLDVSGVYNVLVSVGKSGSKDFVSGDPSSQSSPDIDSIKAALLAGNGRTDFKLTVQAGQPSNPKTAVFGDALTMSTAGVSSSFIVQGQDKYQNRIAGGEDISAMLISKRSGAVIPNQVVDNQDGTYLCSYVTSVAGSYKVDVTLNGLPVGNSPFELAVLAQVASVEMTYAYGSFLRTQTGVSFTVFVQTRDAYGNYLSSNSEQIVFESCLDLGVGCSPDADTCACGGDGGKINPDVAISITYGLGPNVSKTYNGLYKVGYYLFTPGAFTNIVQHNKSYIGCYFDQGNETDSSLWQDPVDAADKCTEYNRRQALIQTAGVRKMQREMAECKRSSLSTSTRESSSNSSSMTVEGCTAVCRPDTSSY
jgi:hypothetical protein